MVAFDCDPETGKLSNERTVFDKKKNGVEAILDGMALDRRGNLWVALFHGSRYGQLQNIFFFFIATNCVCILCTEATSKCPKAQSRGKRRI